MTVSFGETESWGCVATSSNGEVNVDLDESSNEPFYKLIVSTSQSYLVLTLIGQELVSLRQYLTERDASEWRVTDHLTHVVVTFVYDDEFDDQLWLKIDVGGTMIAEIRYVGPTMTSLLHCVSTVVQQVFS